MPTPDQNTERVGSEVFYTTPDGKRSDVGLHEDGDAGDAGKRFAATLLTDDEFIALYGEHRASYVTDKGSKPGHAFRGNQYKKVESAKQELSALHKKPDYRNEPIQEILHANPELAKKAGYKRAPMSAGGAWMDPETGKKVKSFGRNEESADVIERNRTIKKLGMSEAEAKMLDKWVSGGKNAYKQLREDPAMMKLMDKLPIVRGTVYRGMTLSPKDIDSLKVGSTYAVDKIASSSVDPSISGQFSSPERERRGRPVTLEMRQNTGRGIPAGFDKFAEGEILLPKGAKFKVTASRDGFQGTRHIRMIQVKS